MRTEGVAERIGSFDDRYATHYASPSRLGSATTMSVPLAEEIVQDACLSAYRQSSRIDPPEGAVAPCRGIRSTSSLEIKTEPGLLVASIERLPPGSPALLFLKRYKDLTGQRIPCRMRCAHTHPHRGNRRLLL
jgi:hypothetical protein